MYIVVTVSWFAITMLRTPGSFGTNNIPPVIKDPGIEAILQARESKMPSVNVFHTFFNLTTLSSLK